MIEEKMGEKYVISVYSCYAVVRDKIHIFEAKYLAPGAKNQGIATITVTSTRMIGSEATHTEPIAR